MEPLKTPFDDRLPTRNEDKGAIVQAEPARLPDIPIDDAGLKLTSYEAVVRVANLLYSSGLIPTSYKNVKQVTVALLRALELKLPPLQAIEGMSVVNGRVGLMGDLALALVEQSGLLSHKKVSYSGSGDSLVCSISLGRKGREIEKFSFSVAEAKTAGIFDRSPTWRNYPRRMVYYRALGFGLRDVFSDVLRGVKTVEELQDYPETQHLTPTIEETTDATQ
jgi:hypothetical protein